MGVETAGAPPGGFFQRKKCSTQRILCQVDDGNHLVGLENTFIWPTFEKEGNCIAFQGLVENRVSIEICFGSPVILLVHRKVVSLDVWQCVGLGGGG